ncbi:MAG: hypothetical protein GXP62_17975 [Oligoflexia bacterium]|nr:hypothetical protein [Oligoflexia bacterium]
MADTGPDFQRLGDDLYRHWESAMSTWWDQVLESDDVLRATGQNLSAMASARKSYEEGVDQGLKRLHLPTRQDLIQVTRIATLLEERLLQLEDRLLRMDDGVTQLQEHIVVLERETVQARIEAAEARIELREGLAKITARLDALEPASAPKKRGQRRAPARSGTKARSASKARAATAAEE